MWPSVVVSSSIRTPLWKLRVMNSVNAYLGVSWAICSGVLPKMLVPVLDAPATYVVGKIEEII